MAARGEAFTLTKSFMAGPQVIRKPSQAFAPSASPVHRRLGNAAFAAALGMASAIGPTFAGSSSADLIDIPTFVVTRTQDTLLDIARSYDVGYVEIRAANPGVDPWLPGTGKTIAVPTQHILPDAPRRGIVINLPELRLYYFPADGGMPRSFPIGIGGEGMETPVGHTEIIRKQLHPVWIPTRAEREEDSDLPARVDPGPDNPMGDQALYLGWAGYAIHGTNRPYSIGRRDSHGCIRLYPEDILALYKMVRIGTPVMVVNQPAKAGWSGDELYLEVHPSQSDADAIEAGGTPAPGAVDADELVAVAAGTKEGQLDWYAIHLAEERRDGLPVQVTQPKGGF